jgi:hypothetical protein
MTAEQIGQFIQGGKWKSITTELRPSISKNAAGDIQPFYLDREFEYGEQDSFSCLVTNYADPNGKVPLVKILIKGHLVWQGEHPLADGAYKVDYVADEVYEITPLHQGFADVLNRFPAQGIATWKVGEAQDLKGKVFPLFGLASTDVYVDYDLIYVYEGLLFNGSKNVDGRPFDRPENRPTNLQLPLVRK